MTEELTNIWDELSTEAADLIASSLKSKTSHAKDGAIIYALQSIAMSLILANRIAIKDQTEVKKL